MIHKNNHSMYLRNYPDHHYIGGRYLLEIKVSEEFVEFCKNESFTDQTRQLLENRAQESLQAHGFKPRGDHLFYHWFDKSAMLHHIRFPYGNATSLCYEESLGDIFFHQHNVDSLEQRDCLAELFSNWTKMMDYRVFEAVEKREDSE